MKAVSGSLRAGSGIERAAQLAGALAEAAIDALNLATERAHATTLQPRITDLPGLLRPGAVLSTPDGAFCARVHADRIDWTTTYPELAQSLSSS